MVSMKNKLQPSAKQQEKSQNFVPGAPSNYRGPNVPTNDAPKTPTK